MKYWVTTDTHFFHKKMYEYCDRPLGFEYIILKNLKDVIQEDDILIHLGDICMGRDSEAHETFIKAIKCKKWLIRGNHDKKSDTWYLSHGWDFIAKHIVLDIFGKNIILTHEPLKTDNLDYYDLNIHGHMHNNLNYVKMEKQRLVALEYTDYKPVLLRDVVEGRI